MRNYTYKFSGTATVRAASAAIALAEIRLDLPHGATLELIAESDGAPTEMPAVRRVETVLAPAPVPQLDCFGTEGGKVSLPTIEPRPVMTAEEHNAFPRGRWAK